jgi:hypothetical protein
MLTMRMERGVVVWVFTVLKKVRASVVDSLRWRWLPLLSARQDLHYRRSLSSLLC